MRLLLDTHIAIGALTDDPQLSAIARGLIGDADNQVFVSAVTVWEIAIKHALQRYRYERRRCRIADRETR